jgi:hypothetical protein
VTIAIAASKVITSSSLALTSAFSPIIALTSSFPHYTFGAILNDREALEFTFANTEDEKLLLAIATELMRDTRRNKIEKLLKGFFSWIAS